MGEWGGCGCESVGVGEQGYTAVCRVRWLIDRVDRVTYAVIKRLEVNEHRASSSTYSTCVHVCIIRMYYVCRYMMR